MTEKGGTVPSLARDEDLAGVHDTAGEAGSVDGPQGGAQLYNVGPYQRLGEQACVLAGRRRLMLTYGEGEGETKQNTGHINTHTQLTTILYYMRAHKTTGTISQEGTHLTSFER